jgi:hypothetical protein
MRFFTSNSVDYVHGNSIEEDTDGNIIISCRHLDQVNKINVGTGEFMWRLGGIKNEFTFINDPEPFTYQHDARRIAMVTLPYSTMGIFILSLVLMHVNINWTRSIKQLHLSGITSILKLAERM